MTENSPSHSPTTVYLYRLPPKKVPVPQEQPVLLRGVPVFESEVPPAESRGLAAATLVVLALTFTTVTVLPDHWNDAGQWRESVSSALAPTRSIAVDLDGLWSRVAEHPLYQRVSHGFGFAQRDESDVATTAGKASPSAR